jgi:hypothetical protein
MKIKQKSINQTIEIVPSILSADFAILAEGIKKEKARIDGPWRLWFLSLAQSSGRSFERIGS